LVVSGRFIAGEQGRKNAVLFQPGDSPVDQEAIRNARFARSTHCGPLVGVLLRAAKEGPRIDPSTENQQWRPPVRGWPFLFHQPTVRNADVISLVADFCKIVPVLAKPTQI